MVRQLDRLHLDAELLQLLDRGLDLEDGRLLLHARQEEVALDVEELDLQVESLLVNSEGALVLLHYILFLGIATRAARIPNGFDLYYSTH